MPSDHLNPKRFQKLSSDRHRDPNLNLSLTWTSQLPSRFRSDFRTQAQSFKSLEHCTIILNFALSNLKFFFSYRLSAAILIALYIKFSLTTNSLYIFTYIYGMNQTNRYMVGIDRTFDFSLLWSDNLDQVHGISLVQV